MLLKRSKQSIKQPYSIDINRQINKFSGYLSVIIRIADASTLTADYTNFCIYLKCPARKYCNVNLVFIDPDTRSCRENPKISYTEAKLCLRALLNGSGWFCVHICEQQLRATKP